MRNRTDLGIVLTFLREGQRWSQTELAQVAGTAPNVINDYERGRKNLSRERLEVLAALMSVPAERIDATLSCLAANRASARAPSDPEDRFSETRRRIGAIASQVGLLAEEFSRSTLQLLTLEGEALYGRQTAELLWRRLSGRSAAERRLLVEEVRKFRHWALVERVAAESIEKAANHPRQALELAELAVAIAERVPGDALWCSRLQGYGWVHVANGRRVCNELHAMESALSRALDLWKEGEAGDPGLLNPAVVPWIEAACRRAQRRFPEALKRIDQALALDAGELRGKILISKSGILDALGNPEGSTELLLQAAPLIDKRREPRIALMVEFNLLVDLVMLGRAREAEPRLLAVRELAERLGEDLGLIRVVWLEGKIAGGLGRVEAARAALMKVRHDFESRKLTFDYALASLDLAIVLLEDGRSNEVQLIAEEMFRMFAAQEIHREAFAALRIFMEAAAQQKVSIELTQRVIRFMHRFRIDPGLRYEEATGAGDE